MPKFIIPVVWQMWGKMIIEARTLEEAEQVAIGEHPIRNEPLPDGSYIDDSIELDKESVFYGNVVEEENK